MGWLVVFGSVGVEAGGVEPRGMKARDLQSRGTLPSSHRPPWVETAMVPSDSTCPGRDSNPQPLWGRRFLRALCLPYFHHPDARESAQPNRARQ